ncbi:6-cysteine protein (P12p), partial [Plasmodium malariae]
NNRSNNSSNNRSNNSSNNRSNNSSNNRSNNSSNSKSNSKRNSKSKLRETRSNTMQLVIFAIVQFLYFFSFAYKTNDDCDFTREPLNVAWNNRNNALAPVDMEDEPYDNDNNIKYCVKFTKGFEILTFICPKKGINYEGIEMRPKECFEKIRINGRDENFTEILKGSIFESSETDSIIIRRVFIPPTIYADMVIECTCDNSLTFKENFIGARGIMRVHLKRNKIFGCDFDSNIDGDDSTYGRSDGGTRNKCEGRLDNNCEESKSGRSAFVKYYDKSKIRSNESITCNVTINKKEVYLGLICPEGYTIYPSDCFENVLYENKIVNIKELLVSHDIKLHIDKKKRMSFATFILNKNENPKGFSCQCVKNNDNIFPLQANFEYANYESFSLCTHLRYFVLLLSLLVLFL